ncbi:GntR family transcriptional regulator [Microbacterium sediminis]|uniref:GntR family transcriptional regulator n=1 Tax=Microbacterium sediminis TaxID=904291 RepID=UPI000A0606DC|nr:GntR family transcriptional regulator [Microbacterium sediminis]QBR73473.1 GntR family transcriptional regulator [Microbacterium sediminis]
MTAVGAEPAEIAGVLETEIGGLPSGARLPSEHALMQRFGTTRAIVRRALADLEARHLVRRVRGAGSFVNRRIDFVLAPGSAPSLHEVVRAAGATARTYVIAAATLPVPADVAAHLGVEAGVPCQRLRRVGCIDDVESSVAEEWIAPGVLDHVDVGLRAIESLADALRAGRHDPVRAWSRAVTDLAPAEVADRLGVARGAAMWSLETLTREGGDGRALMYSRSWLRQDRVRLVVEL